jgi:hypothetical protein
VIFSTKERQKLIPEDSQPRLWAFMGFPRRFAWQEGYAALSVSASHKDAVVRYICNQKEHHAKRTFKEELLELLRKSGR